MLKKTIDEILYYSFPKDKVKNIMPKILDVNFNYLRIWVVVEMVYWAYCMVMTLHDADFMLCRSIYLVAFITCLVVAAVVFFVVAKQRRAAVICELLLELAILVPGVYIARYLAPKTIIIFASVLIVPVMFITSTLSTLLVLVANIILFWVIGTHSMEPETFKWVFVNQIIFSSIGAVLGHFVNKDRFERLLFAESAVQLAQSNAKLAELQNRYAHYDQLTSLQNRRAYAEMLEQLAKNLPDDCCLIMADINGLKKMNDTCGHEAGDELITGSAECLRRGFDGVDSIYRIGGDEFCIVMQGTEDQVLACQKKLDEVSSRWKGKYVDGISISCGYALARDYPDLDSLLKAADQKMYKIKDAYYKTSGKERRKI